MGLRSIIGVVMLLAVAGHGDLPARAGPAAAGLNHAYVVLDQATFDAIRRSDAVAALLGPSDGGLPDYAPPAADADRIFLRGRETYLELFAPANRFREPVGKAGIGLGADDAGAFGRIDAGWRRACGPGVARETVEYRRVRPPVPWYDSLSCAATATGDGLVLWGMLYRPEFLAWQRAGPGVSRRAVLAGRRAAGQGRFDVAGLTLDLPADAIARMAPQLAAAGLRAARSGGAVRWRGAGWFLELRAGARARLRSIALVPVGPRRGGALRLGRATLAPAAGRWELRFDGDHAALVGAAEPT